MRVVQSDQIDKSFHQQTLYKTRVLSSFYEERDRGRGLGRDFSEVEDETRRGILSYSSAISRSRRDPRESLGLHLNKIMVLTGCTKYKFVKHQQGLLCWRRKYAQCIINTLILLDLS